MNASNILTIAAIQADSLWERSEFNIAQAVASIATATADIVVLPEMFATGFSMDSTKIAQPDNGAIVTAMRNTAIDSGRAVIFSAAISDESKVYNRLFFIEPSGVTHTYDKRHLFRMATEHQHYAAGEDRLIVEYKGWRICPLVCYDLRFPVFSRGADQYDVLIYIASWPAARSYAWSTLLRARAIENQSYCVGVNRVGNDPKNQYSGDSIILDYLGQPIAEAKPSKVDTIIAQLSKADLVKFRASFPAHLDADHFELKR